MKRVDMILDMLIGMLRSLLKKTTRFNNEKGFKHYRMIAAVAMIVIVAMLLTPRITIKPPAYEIGSIAKKNIVADHDFLVIDKNAYEAKKVEAMQDVYIIYDKNPRVEVLLKSNIDMAIPIFQRLHQQLANSPSDSGAVCALEEGTGKTAHKEIESALAIALSADDFNSLCGAKFSPKILESIKKHLGKTYTTTTIVDVSPTEEDIKKGIIVRDAQAKTETLKKSWRSFRNIERTRTALAKEIAASFPAEEAKLSKATQMLASRLLQPLFIYNATALENRRQEALSKITPVYFPVLKNEMIIRKGEKITQSDIDKIEAMAKDSNKSLLSQLSIFLGVLSLVFLFSGVMYLVSREWLGKKEDSGRAILFIMICLVLQVAITRFGIFIAASVDSVFLLTHSEAFLFAIPFTTSTLLVALLINKNTAVCFAVLSSLLIALLFESKMPIASMSLFGGIIASYHIIQCHRRSAFFRSGFILSGINVIIIIAFAMVANDLFSTATLFRALWGTLGGFLASFLVAGLAPLFETSFGYLTNIRLLELGNLNNQIFQRMMIEAPGTYHHSIVVASMVEAAAEATGANPLLAKTAAFYHDIGKVKKPYYFIENQKEGENPHDKLSPKMSSSILITHTKDGAEISEQIGLPRAIIDIIRQHHGSSLISYFFNKAKNDADESIRALSEDNFRYPGPKPQTKEAALVMLADVVEASTRTLHHPTPARIENLVRERITRVFVDGQLDECQLTMGDLYKIAEIFTRLITGIFHQRVDYPEDIPSGMPKRGKANGNGEMPKNNGEMAITEKAK